MYLRSLPFGMALAALAPFAGISASAPALAFGCGSDRAVECYEKVATPDVYKTVAHPVVVAPGRTELVREPAVLDTRTERVETSPGRWTVERMPAQYGAVDRTIMVKPAGVTYVTVPAQYRTVRETVVVQPASFRWERQVDRRGNETMCKILVPAVTRDVERTVQVSPPGRVAQTVRQTVVVSPATERRVYTPPTYGYVNRTVVVRPATERVVQHPPVMDVVETQVLVQKGSTTWQRASRGWF